MVDSKIEFSVREFLDSADFDGRPAKSTTLEAQPADDEQGDEANEAAPKELVAHLRVKAVIADNG